MPAIPKIVTQKIFPLYLNCNPATLRLLRFQKLRAKKIFQSIYTESAILRLCDSCNSKNCYPFILNSCYPCNYVNCKNCLTKMICLTWVPKWTQKFNILKYERSNHYINMLLALMFPCYTILARVWYSRFTEK